MREMVCSESEAQIYKKEIAEEATAAQNQKSKIRKIKPRSPSSYTVIANLFRRYFRRTPSLRPAPRGSSYLMLLVEGVSWLTSLSDGNCAASQPPPSASINCTLAVI